MSNYCNAKKAFRLRPNAVVGVSVLVRVFGEKAGRDAMKAINTKNDVVVHKNKSDWDTCWGEILVAMSEVLNENM